MISQNPDLVTDNILSFAWDRIESENLDTSSHYFEEVFVPLTTEYLKSFGREEALSLGQIAGTAGELGVKNQEFWDIIEKKLLTERLIRNVSNRDLCVTIFKMGRGNCGSKAFFETCEAIISKHISGLDAEDIECVRQGFRARRLGSSGFLERLSGTAESFHA